MKINRSGTRPLRPVEPQLETDAVEAAIAQRVSRSFKVRKTALFASGRIGAREALARHVAMYLMHVGLGFSYSDVAVRFNRHRTSVLYACARVEDRREEDAFDARVGELERLVLADRRRAR